MHSFYEIFPDLGGFFAGKQSSTLPPVRRTCPVILFVGQVNHAKSHVRLSGDDIFMRVSPYLVPWLRELQVIVQCRMCAAHWYIHIL